MTQNTNLDSSDVVGAIRTLQKGAKSVQTETHNTGRTLSTAQMLGGFLLRSGAAAVSDTTPTAAALVAAVPNVQIGDVFELKIRNKNTGTLTLVAGSGVTLEGTTTVAQDYCRSYLIRFTAVADGAEAVTLSGNGTQAV